ncbi:MAG TPA: glycosyltransferase family 39 protein [Candidatus Omnitrophota bacterium]|nr:glycosyltransferase family 39 protein [Candidatus Omnitrophota bacterium]HPS19566.1 glycosyltransferase family 39 protein [Candidatus Omnitrophota bacterium]
MMFLVGIISVFVMGLAVVAIIAAATGYRPKFLETLALSFFAGMGAVSLALFYCGLIGVRYSMGVCVALFIFAFVLMVFGFSRGYLPRNVVGALRSGRGLKTVEKIFIAGIFIQVLWVWFLVVPSPVESHDAVANYALKAKMFYYDKGISSGFFRSQEATVAHPDYPLLLPLSMTWIYQFTGFNDVIITRIMPVFYMCALLLIYSLSRAFFSRTYSLMALFVMATVPQFFDYATIIHTDIILSVFIGCGFMYMMKYLSGRHAGDMVISSVLMALALFTKNEAVLFFLMFFAVLSIVGASTRASRSVINSALVVICVIAGPWFIVKLFFASGNNDLDMAKITPGRFFENIKCVPAVLDIFQQQVFGPKKWNIFWPLIIGSVILKWKQLFSESIRCMTMFIVFCALGYFAAYLFMTGNDSVYFYANTTMSRFMLHFTVLCGFYAAMLLKNDIEPCLEKWR